jgi:hypothetical protein
MEFQSGDVEILLRPSVALLVVAPVADSSFVLSVPQKLAHTKKKNLQRDYQQC